VCSEKGELPSVMLRSRDAPDIKPCEERFAFGENWNDFIRIVDESRISEASHALQSLLAVGMLDGSTFLDVGCGSGLVSLSAVRLGADRVDSFDVDLNSVECRLELKRRFAPQATHWQIEHGDVLDKAYLTSLGTYDVVYAWGVLHHTGDMWDALDNIDSLVAPGGLLCLAIYNDQGSRSILWKQIKRTYNRLPPSFRTPYSVGVMLPRELRAAVIAIVRLRPLSYLRSWRDYRAQRGMSRWHDLTDWVGGYPFEVAKPEEIFRFFRGRGFMLQELVTCGGGLGCNQFVFRRSADKGLSAFSRSSNH
jgi:2-polyprenyl-3-methyl-5-hydroxy-6-metoxy-1,4-benzoquinol methylase